MKIECPDTVGAGLQQVGQFIQLGCIRISALPPQLLVDNHASTPCIGSGVANTAGHGQAFGQGQCACVQRQFRLIDRNGGFITGDPVKVAFTVVEQDIAAIRLQPSGHNGFGFFW